MILGTTNNCQAFCFQWSSYQSFSFATCWSIWRINVWANRRWTSKISFSSVARKVFTYGCL